MPHASTGPRAGGRTWPLREVAVLVATGLAYFVLPRFAPAAVSGTTVEILLGVVLGVVVGIGLRVDMRLAFPIGLVAALAMTVRFTVDGVAFPFAMCLAVLTGAEIIVLITVLDRTGASRLEKPQDVFNFAVIALVVAGAAGLVAAFVVRVADPSLDDFVSIFRQWAVDDVFGLLCIAPAFMTMHRPSRWSWGSAVEYGIVSAVSLGVAWYIFGVVTPENPGLLGWPYLVILGPLWMALRLGVAAVTPLTAVITWLALVCTAAGAGVFSRASNDVFDQLVAVQLFAIVIALTLLLVAVLRDARLTSLRQVRESSRLLHEVVDGSTALVFAKSYEGDDAERGRYVIVNRAWSEQAGKSSEETVGRSDAELFPSELANTYLAADQAVMAANEPILFEERGQVEGTDALHYYSSSKFPLRDEDGRPWGVGGIATDTTDLVRAVQRERRQGDLLRAVFELSPTPAMRLSVGPDDTITALAANSSMCFLMEAPDGAVAECDLMEHVHPDDASVVGEVLAAARRADTLRRSPSARQREIRLVTNGGRTVWVLMSAAMVGTGAEDTANGDVEIVAQFEDFTARRLAEEALSDQALRDSVTGLPNRRALHDRLDQALARLNRGKGAVAVLFCDLDHFKDVNDTLGHQAGDLLLVEVARRMQAVLRPEDTVARIGGDEFIAIGEGMSDVGEALAMAGRLTERLRSPWMQGEKVFRPSMSIGVAFVDDAALGADEVLRRADLAMYRAKENGRDRVEIYEKSADDRYQVAVALQHDLRRAIDTDTLLVHYQPIVMLADRRLIGGEALVRMVGRDGSLLQPHAFVPQAEVSGLVVPMGAWVVRTAIAQLRQWREAGRDLTLSVNVSPAQLREVGFAGFVLAEADAAGVDPSRLAVEVTETALLSDPARSTRELSELSRHGVGVCLDDFGTGYSSLSWLTQFPVDVVKVDRSFTDELGIDDRKTAIVSAVIQVSHDLGFSVVAEGVETPDQAERLLELGCDRGQGFLFGRPVPITDDAWLA